jgi:hypothetical protein
MIETKNSHKNFPVKSSDDFLSSPVKPSNNKPMQQPKKDIFSTKNVSKYSAIVGGMMIASRYNVTAGCFLGITGLFTYKIMKEIETYKFKQRIRK